MQNQLKRLSVLTALLLPAAAGAEPVTLKMSFFTSDRSTIYQCQIKPFVDAVNSDPTNQIRIEVNFGANRVLAEQANLVLGGATDIASIAPTAAHDQFPETSVMLLPGLFRDQPEANRVFSALIGKGALADFQKFTVLGTTVSAGDSIHSRKPTATLADLRGQTVRASNEIELVTLKKFGAESLFLPFNQTLDSLAQGKVDAVTGAPAILFEFGFGRLTSHHYLLKLSSIPGVLAMSRARFDSLPPAAQEVIRKYSGEQFNKQSVACLEAKGREMSALLESDARRKVVTPSQADQAAADKVFATVTEEWAAQNPRNRELLALVKAEIAKVQAAK